MTVIIVKTPRGLFNIFSSEANGWVAKDLTSAQVKEWYALAAREMASDLLSSLERGENPFGEYGIPYQDCEKIHREFNTEEDDDAIPVVNPQYAYN